METTLQLKILPQPNNTTCGPTCLQAVYGYYGEELPLEQVIRETPKLEDGGTLAVLLGCHALQRGYDATIYTLNLQVFDPTWFKPGAPPLAERLTAQMAAKSSPKLNAASTAYLEFLQGGGKIRMDDMTGDVFRRYLKKSVPILTGLSATYLYQSAREHGPNCEPDDVRGVPAGHFVVLCGYDKENRTVLVADPFVPNPFAPQQHYEVSMDRVIRAILLGIITYDANLLIIQPRSQREGRPRADSDHR